jgi:hypothetical protein
MDPLDISQFISIAGAGAIIVAVIEAVKRAAAWTDDQTSRIAPLFSIMLGVVIVVVGLLVGNLTEPVADVASLIYGGVLTGIIAGATSQGIYGTVGKPVARAVAGTPSGYNDPS